MQSFLRQSMMIPFYTVGLVPARRNAGSAALTADTCNAIVICMRRRLNRVFDEQTCSCPLLPSKRAPLAPGWYGGGP